MTFLPLKITPMISKTEFRDNMDKHLDLAKEEQSLVQRNETETSVLSVEKYLEPDDDFARAITVEELLEGVEGHIRKLYRQGKK